MRNLLTIGLAVLAALALAAPANAEFVWAEVGDAGSLPSTAQAVLPGPPGEALNFITGTLTTVNDVDMYLIFIANPAAFSATTVGQPGTLVDTQLFLFNFSGLGVEANDDASAATTRSTLSAGNPFSPTEPGFYYLAISSFNNDPVSLAGQLIFPNAQFGVVGPTGPGGGSEITGYTNAGGFSGTYQIALTGATLGVIPEPGSIALLSMGVIGLAGHGYRRWRRAA